LDAFREGWREIYSDYENFHLLLHTVHVTNVYTQATSSVQRTRQRQKEKKRKKKRVTHSHRLISTPRLRLSIPALPLLTPRTLERVRLGLFLGGGERLEEVGIFDLLDFLLALFGGEFLWVWG
jgi:hypothetical protein